MDYCDFELDLDEETFEALMEICAVDNKTISEVVDEALRAYLDMHERND